MTEAAIADPIRDRLDAAKLRHDLEVLLRAGAWTIQDGRIVHRKVSAQAVCDAIGVPAPHLSQVRRGHLRPSGNLAMAIMGLLNANVNDYLLPLPEAVPEPASEAA